MELSGLGLRSRHSAQRWNNVDEKILTGFSLACSHSYYGQHVDVRVTPPNPEQVAKALVPDYALGPHTASLGLTFNTGDKLGANFSNGAFVGQHGSWNRKPRSGYKVIFVPFSGGKPSGAPVDVLTGFISASDKAQGRPVGVVIDKSGALLVADDVGNHIPSTAQKIIDVTGAGDAATAGLVHGLMKNLPLADAAKLGQDMAARVIASDLSTLD